MMSDDKLLKYDFIAKGYEEHSTYEGASFEEDSKAFDQEIDKLAEEAQEEWWKNNKAKFLR